MSETEKPPNTAPQQVRVTGWEPIHTLEGRARTQVASAAAAAAAASLGVKPQAEAPHSAPVAPRGALRRRLRRRTCTARAHSAPSIHAAGTSWPVLGERSSSVARARQGARRKGRAQVDGKWREGWEPLRPPMRLEPVAAGRTARAEGCRQKRRKVVKNRGGPSQYPGKVCCARLFQGPKDYMYFLSREFPEPPRPPRSGRRRGKAGTAMASRALHVLWGTGS